MMPRETIDKLIEVLRYFAEMTTSPYWIIQYIAEIEEELTKPVNTNLCPSCGDGNNHFKICINPNCPHGNYAT